MWGNHGRLLFQLKTIWQMLPPFILCPSDAQWRQNFFPSPFPLMLSSVFTCYFNLTHCCLPMFQTLNVFIPTRTSVEKRHNLCKWNTDTISNVRFHKIPKNILFWWKALWDFEGWFRAMLKCLFYSLCAQLYNNGPKRWLSWDEDLVLGKLPLKKLLFLHSRLD